MLPLNLPHPLGDRQHLDPPGKLNVLGPLFVLNIKPHKRLLAYVERHFEAVQEFRNRSKNSWQSGALVSLCWHWDLSP